MSFRTDLPSGSTVEKLPDGTKVQTCVLFFVVMHPGVLSQASIYIKNNPLD